MPQRRGGGHAMEATEVETKAANPPAKRSRQSDKNHKNTVSGKEIIIAISAKYEISEN